jgi:phage-related minor tail protein
MEIEKLFVSLAVDAAEYVGGLARATSGGLSWAADWGKKVSAALSAAFMIGVVLVVTALASIGAAAFTVASDINNATVDIQSQLGATGEEAERLGNIAADVWGNNFAGSIGEAADALVQVRQQLGDLSDQELQRATENAFRLADTFDVETSESINAAKTLMENFGLSSDEAFDFVTAGFQRGLNSSDDFLDTIGEYSTQFANGGADAAQFFSLLESGLQGGMLGTDRAADAFKEFRVRIQDGSTLTAESLEMIGINSQELFEGMSDGTVTAADAFQVVVDALGDVDDTAVQMQAGVGLLGTQFEDLGTDAALGLSLIGTELEDMAGATSGLDIRYNTLGDVVEGFKRRAMLALEPIGAVLLDLANRIMPHINTAFAFFETNVVPAIEMVADAVAKFIANLEEGMSPLDAFIEAIWSIAPPEVLDFLVRLRDEILPQLVAWFEENVQPIIDMVTQFVSWKDILIVLAGAILATVIPAIVAMIVSMAPIILAIIAIVAIVAFLRNAWENDWGGIQGKVQAVIDFVSNLITTVMTAIQTFWAENGEAILAKANEIWGGIKTAVDTIINAISEIITTVVTAIQEFWAEHGETILAKAEEIWTAISEFISGIWDAITAIFEAFKSAFEGDWTAFGENLRLAWDEAWNAIVTFLGTVWDLVKPVLVNLWNSLKAWWDGIDWASLGRNVVDGIIDGLGNLVDRLKGALESAAQAAQDAWNGFWGIGSPAKWMIDSAKNIIEGASIGLDGSQLVAQAQSIAARVAAPFAAIEPVSIGDRIGGMGGLSMAGGGGQETSYSYAYNNYGSQPKDPASWFRMRQKLDEVKV